MKDEKAEGAVDFLLGEAEKKKAGNPREYTKRLGKPFPHKVDFSRSSLSKHSTSLETGGEPWMARVYAIKPPFTDKVFQALDLHSEAGGKKAFIGWVGGTITPGGKVKDPKTGETQALRPTLFLEEAQADVVQRSVYYTTEERYKEAIKRRAAATAEEWGKAYREYEELKKEYGKMDVPASSAVAGIMLRTKLGKEEVASRMDELFTQMSKLQKRYEQEVKLFPEFVSFRSKLENYFKRWVDAFFNAALDYAKENGCYYMLVITSERLLDKWQVHTENPDIFERVYDRTAQKWGMVRHSNKWWVGKVGGLKPFESVLWNFRADALAEGIDPPDYWKQHLDKFIEVFARYEGVDLDNLDGYAGREAFGHVFRFWTDEVQPELKQDPGWRSEVEQYIESKWGVDVSEMWEGGPGGTAVEPESEEGPGGRGNRGPIPTDVDVDDLMKRLMNPSPEEWKRLMGEMTEAMRALERE